MPHMKAPPKAWAWIHQGLSWERKQEMGRESGLGLVGAALRGRPYEDLSGSGALGIRGYYAV